MSSSACTICQHERRAEIELLLAGCARRETAATEESVGTLRRPSIVRIARRFDVGRMSLQRHWAAHVPPEQRAALITGPGIDLVQAAVFAAESGAGLHEQIARSGAQFLARSLAALAVGLDREAGLLYDRYLSAVRLCAQLNGDLQRASSVVINNVAVLQSPIMRDVQTMLVQRLDPYPEARLSVIQGLEELAARAATEARPALEASAA